MLCHIIQALNLPQYANHVLPADGHEITLKCCSASVRLGPDKWPLIYLICIDLFPSSPGGCGPGPTLHAPLASTGVSPKLSSPPPV